MRRTLKRSKTPTARDRIEALERGLEAAKAERRRLQEEIRALEARDPLAGLREALKRQNRRRASGDVLKALRADVDPDDSVS
jgi:hypothetical protein